MKKASKFLAVLLALTMLATLTACADRTDTIELTPDTRTVTDSAGRQVKIPAQVERIVCLNVGALRYTCYMGAQDKVVGVEDYEQTASLTRLYNYVNADLFASLPVIGANGKPYPEEIIAADPDVIMLAALDANDAEGLSAQTGIPVVVIPSSDSMMDEGAYETFRIMGQVYGMEDRAAELCAYMDSIKADLETRTANIPEGEKPSVYVGGVAFKGFHGMEGTEADYGPLAAIHAKNLADTTGQSGAFDMDLEQILAWDPDILFVDFNGLSLINEDYAANSAFYESLTAVQQGKVYAQISFRAYASNLETALADTYYCGSIVFPERFVDIDPVAKADEIFEMLLGETLYDDLKEAGYEFRPVTLGQ